MRQEKRSMSKTESFRWTIKGNITITIAVCMPTQHSSEIERIKKAKTIPRIKERDEWLWQCR